MTSQRRRAHVAAFSSTIATDLRLPTGDESTVSDWHSAVADRAPDFEHGTVYLDGATGTAGTAGTAGWAPTRHSPAPRPPINPPPDTNPR